MSLFGDLLGFGASLIGGGGSSRKDVAIAQDRASRERYREFQQMKGTAAYQFARQENFARRSRNEAIRFRTADAKAAGIHPLYALGHTGAGGIGMHPISAGNANNMGVGTSQDGPGWPGTAEALSRALSGSEKKKAAVAAQKRQHWLDQMYHYKTTAEVRKMEAEAHEARAYATAAGMAKNANRDYGGSIQKDVIDGVRTVPAEVTAKSGHVEKGRHASMARVILKDGTVLEGPSEKLTEMLEDAGALVTGYNYGKNRAKKYKPQVESWLKRKAKALRNAGVDIQRYWIK